MTRKIVYSVALVTFITTFVMTLASIILPVWISYDTTTSAGTRIHHSLGLHSQCVGTEPGDCQPFPTDLQCRGDERAFCSMWRTVGFLMSFAVVLQGMTLVAFIVMLSSGVQKRVSGRPVVCGLLLLVSLVEIASMGLVTYLYDNDERFFPGWRLDHSWSLCTASWAISMVTALGVWVSVYVLPMEGDYELIPGSD